MVMLEVCLEVSDCAGRIAAVACPAFVQLDVEVAASCKHVSLPHDGGPRHVDSPA